MSYLEIFILSLALSIDALVVSFSYGLVLTHKRFKTSMFLAAYTGGFQGVMPIIGYFLTNFVKVYIEPYAKVIVFMIFVYLGVKFIKEAFENKSKKVVCPDMKCLIMLGIATSIDAFSAGITLSLAGNKIWIPALTIAFVTFINSCLGFWFGGKLKHMPSKVLEIIAGLILIGLGVKAVI